MFLKTFSHSGCNKTANELTVTKEKILIPSTTIEQKNSIRATTKNRARHRTRTTTKMRNERE